VFFLIENSKFEFVENQTLLSAVGKYRNIIKNDKKVVIISQDILTFEILSSVKNIVKDNPSMSFYFKPHPNEYSYIKNSSEFYDLDAQENFHIVHRTANLYELYSECKYVIGVYSAALIEALYFGCTVFILKLPGSEMMDYLVEEKKFKTINEFKFS